MKIFTILGLALMLAACTQLQPVPPVHITVDGPTTAQALNARYADTRQNCGTPSIPAFLCSGVVLRATSYSTAYDPWDASPTAQARDGVSFSYLRKDSKFGQLVFSQTNGFIFYPIFDMPPDKVKLEIFCSFVIDGWTNNRPDHGCGAHPGYPVSQLCHLSNILTAADWQNHYRAVGGVSQSLCGFNVRDSANDHGGPSFYQSLLAKSTGSLASTLFFQQNEIIIKSWTDDTDGRLPIQAFFYLNNSATGLAEAKDIKRRFLAKTGIDLPLIQVTLPQTASADARFDYVAADNRREQVTSTPVRPAPRTQVPESGRCPSGLAPCA